MVGEVGVEDAGGSYEFAFVAQGGGSERMALLSWSYKTMRYLILREDVTGNRPF